MNKTSITLMSAEDTENLILNRYGIADVLVIRFSEDGSQAEMYHIRQKVWIEADNPVELIRRIREDGEIVTEDEALAHCKSLSKKYV